MSSLPSLPQYWSSAELTPNGILLLNFVAAFLLDRHVYFEPYYPDRQGGNGGFVWVGAIPCMLVFWWAAFGTGHRAC